MENKVNQNAYDYFTHSSGGSSRNWTKRYMMMIAKYEVLLQFAITDEQKEFLKGFKECLNTFHEKPKRPGKF